MERTLSIVKPDGVERGLIGEVVKRFEDNGLKVIGLKMVRHKFDCVLVFFNSQCVILTCLISTPSIEMCPRPVPISHSAYVNISQYTEKDYACNTVGE